MPGVGNRRICDIQEGGSSSSWRNKAQSTESESSGSSTDTGGKAKIVPDILGRQHDGRISLTTRARIYQRRRL